MVIPVGRGDQELMVLAKRADGTTTTTARSARPVRAFDPGVGALGPLIELLQNVIFARLTTY